MAQTRVPLAIVGGGNMAQAIVRGGLDSSILTLSQVAVAEPEPERRDVFRAWGVRAVKTPEELATWLRAHEPPDKLGNVLLAVKPQNLAAAGAQYARLLAGPRRVVISILAGTPTHRVQQALGSHLAVVRVMTNTPAQVRKAATAVALGAGARSGDDELAIEVFGALGNVVQIDESLMDAFTAVAGSGPAYVFYLTEAMTKAAIEVGFDPKTAAVISRWTVAGSAALLGATDQAPEALRAAVTSKGGTTAAATAVLDGCEVMDAFIRAITAARDRGSELGGS